MKGENRIPRKISTIIMVSQTNDTHNSYTHLTTLPTPKAVWILFAPIIALS